MKRHNIDHDDVKPWNWATLAGHSDPVEIVSYPDTLDKPTPTIMVRMTVGDPTSIKKVLLRNVAAFSPDRHEWSRRERVYYGDNPTAFRFKDEVLKDEASRTKGVIESWERPGFTGPCV